MSIPDATGACESAVLNPAWQQPEVAVDVVDELIDARDYCRSHCEPSGHVGDCRVAAVRNILIRHIREEAAAFAAMERERDEARAANAELRALFAEDSYAVSASHDCDPECDNPIAGHTDGCVLRWVRRENAALRARLRARESGEDARAARRLAMQAMRYLTPEQIAEVCRTTGTNVTICSGGDELHTGHKPGAPINPDDEET